MSARQNTKEANVTIDVSRLEELARTAGPTHLHAKSSAEESHLLTLISLDRLAAALEQNEHFAAANLVVLRDLQTSSIELAVKRVVRMEDAAGGRPWLCSVGESPAPVVETVQHHAWMESINPRKGFVPVSVRTTEGPTYELTFMTIPYLTDFAQQAEGENWQFYVERGVVIVGRLDVTSIESAVRCLVADDIRKYGIRTTATGQRHVLSRVHDWRARIRRFAERILTAWPDARFRLQPHRQRGDATPFIHCPPEAFPEIGQMVIVRDSSMEAFFHTHGVALAGHKESPLVLGFRAEGPDVAELTIATPEEAAQDRFSAWAIGLLAEACGVETTADYEGMSGVGFDNIATGVEDIHTTLRGFLSAALMRWPQATVVTEPTSEGEPRLLDPELLSAQPAPSRLWIVRDADMQSHVDEFGGCPMPDGDGGLALYIDSQQDATYALTLVTPEHISHNAFSAWAVEELSKACGRSVQPVQHDHDPSAEGRL